MGLLLLLNVILRIPSVPHETGHDSFVIHFLSNSVSSSGYAEWWLKWLSVFGLYPYSYASAVPFEISGVSQLTGISIEYIILLLCIFFSLFIVFCSYLLASIFYKDFLFRFFFSSLFSLSSLAINTWTVTGRSQFLVFVPLFLYIVFKVFNSGNKFLILYVLIAIFLLSTHHFFYLALLYSVLALITFYLYKHRLKLFSLFAHRFHFCGGCLYISLVLVLSIVPFVFSGKIGLISSGSRYEWIISMMVANIRNIGFLFLISLGGFLYISLKKSKIFEEYVLLTLSIPTIILSYNLTYGYFMMSVLMLIFGSIGVNNVMKNYNLNHKFVLTFIVVFILLTVSFSSFFSNWRLGESDQSGWYMTEETYITGEWINGYINEDNLAMPTFLGVETRMLIAICEGKLNIYGELLSNFVYGLIAFNETDLQKNSVFSASYYFDGPYFLNENADPLGELAWTLQFPVNDKRSLYFINQHNISYFIEDNVYRNAFSNSLPENKCKIYESGKMRLWYDTM
jgi:hypothetical protein